MGIVYVAEQTLEDNKHWTDLSKEPAREYGSLMTPQERLVRVGHALICEKPSRFAVNSLPDPHEKHSPELLEWIRFVGLMPSVFHIRGRGNVWDHYVAVRHGDFVYLWTAALRPFYPKLD